MLKICIKHTFKQSMHFGKIGYNTPTHITQTDSCRKCCIILGPGKQSMFLMKIPHDMESTRKSHWKKFHAGSSA